MNAPLKHGILQVEVQQDNGRSIISSLRQRMPLRASNPLYFTDREEVFFYIMNPAAGLLQGDQHSILVRLKQDAQAVVFGQGATKVFRSPQGNLSRVFTTLIVEQGARLEYMPEVVIPFAESCLFSRTNLQISSQASAFFWEITAPGRVARQELFKYNLLDQQTNIFLDGELIFSDRFMLEPPKVLTFLQTWNGQLGVMHGYTHMGTFWAIDPNMEKAMLELVQRNTEDENGFLEHMAERYNILIAGTAICKQAYCFRALGHSAENIQEGFKEIWRILRLRLYNELEWPWRKF
ncbi:urease accessory protein UreD [Desulfosporosinus metallidurans]|uniref:Urease accessory protein UreD n=1 Tax=Desulfosporosinus metallidurans TaxID=1888891 RepID=A0A1Q8QXC8_9FIRM|nr:urease accessory protein UreD [Desulfosporosinus metallidurans]OLN31991.1 Urease accessory protein UreD [Desulfosporosinus metallidurans]